MLETITHIAPVARGSVLHFKRHTEASTNTRITLAANEQSGRLVVRVVGERQENLDEAVDHIQRITLSMIPWEKRRVSPESAATIMNLFQSNLPNFKGFYRGFRAPDLGQARAGARGWDDKSSIALDGTMLPLLYEIDKEEEKIVAANKAGAAYDARRYVNVCAAALEYFLLEFEQAPLPAQEEVLLFRNVDTALLHEHIRAKFSGQVKDIIHDRRGDADLSIGGKIYVVFQSAEDANCVPPANREYPTNTSQFNDARSRRLQVLHCIVNGIPLSGRGLRKSARVNLRQRIRELHETAGTNEEIDADVRDDAEAELVPEEYIDPVGEAFVHVGQVRDHEVVDEQGSWVQVQPDTPAQQEFRLPHVVKIDHRCAAWQLRNALRSRYVPHQFARPRRDGKKPRHTIYEDMRITESAFFHILDALWKIDGFRGQMERIIKENDVNFRRNNWQRLQCANRPRCYHNPFQPVFDRDGRETLSVPRRYERLVTITDAEGLRQATAILRSLSAHDVTGIDTEGGSHVSWPETIQVSSKLHSILVDVRTCMQHASTNLLNDFIYWLFANPSKKFGMAFDEADRNKIAAAIGPCVSEHELKRLVLTAKVDDIRQLVFDTFAYNENGRFIGLADYVMERPRLSHFVHAVLQKKLGKAYTCSMWASRPLFDEQLTYAHLDCICIVLMVERCLEQARGPDVFKDMTRKVSSQGWRQASGSFDEDDDYGEYDDYPFISYERDTSRAGNNAPTTSRVTPSTNSDPPSTIRAAPRSGTVAAEFAAYAAEMPRFPGMEGLNAKKRAKLWNKLRPKTTDSNSYDDGSEWEVYHPPVAREPSNAR